MANIRIWKESNETFLNIEGQTETHYIDSFDYKIEDGNLVVIKDLSPIYPEVWEALVSEIQNSRGEPIGNLIAVERYLARLKNIVTETNITNTNIDVSIQDQHSDIIIAKLSNIENQTTISANASIEDQTITVTDPTGFAVGKYLSIFDIISNRFYVGYIVAVAVNDTKIDSPLDFAYPVGSFVTSGISDMAVDGSTLPVIFGLRNTTETIGITADITRVIITVLCTNAPTYATFGDLTKLVNGIVLRKIDGKFRNIFNIKTNGELQGLMYDLSAADAVNPNQGQNGYVARLTFASPGKIGVVIRLAPGEDLQMIIQDDISDIELFEIVCEGHEVVLSEHEIAPAQMEITEVV